MKRLLLSTAILAASTMSAAAQEAGGMFRTQAEPTEIQASNFIGMRVYSSEQGVEAEEFAGIQDNWEDIGEIGDVILSRDGSVEAVLVDIGGFLGIGERTVAVNMDALQFVADSETAEDVSDYFLVMTASRADLEAAPEYQRGDMAATGDQAGMAATEGDAAMTEGEQTQTAEGETTILTEGEQTDTAAAEGDAVMTEGEQTDMAATEGDAVMTEGEQTDMAATEGDAAMTEGEQTDMAEGETTILTEGEQTETAATETGDATMRTPIEREGFVAADTAALTSEDLTGTRVYDANDDWVGSIDRLLLTADGQITDVVVDVGGFLGIGAKPVALPMQELDILQQADGGEVRVYVPMTREELEAMPEADDQG